MNRPIPTITNTPDEICAHITSIQTDEEKQEYLNNVLEQIYTVNGLGIGKEVTLCMKIMKGSFSEKLKERSANTLFNLHATIKDSFEIVDVATTILPVIKAKIRPNVAARLLRVLDKREYILTYNYGAAFLVNALTVIEENVEKKKEEYKEAALWIDNIIHLQSKPTNMDEHFNDLATKLEEKFSNKKKGRHNFKTKPILLQAIYHLSCQLITSNRSVTLAIKGLQHCSDYGQFYPELPREMLELFAQSKECSMKDKHVINAYLKPFRRIEWFNGRDGSKKLYSPET